MRAPQKSNRSRGRNNRKVGGNTANRVYDSAGPEGKVRGTPQQIIEKYQSLARDALTSDDRVLAENFLQHAEHYQRILIQNAALQEQRREQQANDDSGNAPETSNISAQTPNGMDQAEQPAEKTPPAPLGAEPAPDAGPTPAPTPDPVDANAAQAPQPGPVRRTRRTKSVEMDSMATIDTKDDLAEEDTLIAPPPKAPAKTTSRKSPRATTTRRSNSAKTQPATDDTSNDPLLATGTENQNDS